MELQVINPGFAYMIEKIMGFQTEDTTTFWSEPLYHFFPQLDREYASSLPLEDKKSYFRECLQTIYQEQESTINEKTLLYARYWAECRPQITAALSDAFELDCGKLFQDMECRISLNPIMPRYLDEDAFDMFYLCSEKGFIGLAIHEIIHFIWFHVWHKTFGDSYDEYESPSLKWILSEMVVESIMKDPRLSSINPYFDRTQGGCIYPYFFDMKADGAYVLDTLDDMYRTQGITDFMTNSYHYCLEHEAEIRRHIQEAEET